MEDCLRQQRALEALQTHVAGLRLESTQTSAEDADTHEIPRNEAAEVAIRARRVAVESYDDQQVVAACTAATALCSAPAWPLCIDVAVLTTLDAGCYDSKTESKRLARDLANSRHGSALRGPESNVQHSRVPSDEAGCQRGCPAAEAVVHALAESTIAAEHSTASDTKDAQREARLQAARQWTLLLAFCAQHGLPLDCSRLARLAAANDWIFFLAQASTHFLSLKQIIALAAEHFTDQSLRHHVLHVLTRQLGPAQQLSTEDDAALPGDESPDLLEVLHAASKAEAPELELLRQADLLQWPVLAVLAASHPDASASRCMAAWLRATLQLEGSDGAARGEEQTGRQEALRALRAACRRGFHDAAADAAQIFLPACPLLKCLRMMQAAAQGRFAEMLRYREELTSAMTPPPARRPGSSGEGETEAEWVMRITWTLADDLLAGVASWTDRLPILERLVPIDLPVPGGSGAEQYRQALLLYELFEGRADQYLVWSCQEDTSSTSGRIKTEAALQTLIADHSWAKASRWADVTGHSQHAITLAHAEALLTEWQSLMWLPGQRQHAWDDIQQLFSAQQLPPVTAARFLISAAERLGCKGLLTLREQGPLIKDAACWLRKARLLEPSVEERAEVLKQMARAVQLLSARVSLSDSADGQKPAQQLPLVAPWASRDPEDDETRAVDASSDASGVDFRLTNPSASSAAPDSDTDQAFHLFTDMRESLNSLIGQPSKAEITAALRSQLEQGDVAGARKLSSELVSPPIDLVLAEAAAAVIQQCRPAVSQEAGKPVQEAVPAAVLSYLSRRGHEKLDTPLDVLDALEACAAKGAARALCALAAASFRAATLLGMTCEEAASLGPRQSLQVLLMKGPQAAPLAIQYAAAYHLSVEETADVLSDSFLKGLLAAHHDTAGSIQDAWTVAGFREACEDLHAPEALGSALVQVLLERHGALPAEVECGLLLAAHSCYEAGSCADALEVLVQLAQRAMQQWAQSGDWRPLAQLISGMGHYKALRGGLDILVANEQLELLLSRRSASQSSTGARMWRAAVLAAIKRQRPDDEVAWELAHQHFGCARETAASLQLRAQARADADVQIKKAGLQESLTHLDAMSAAIAAARAYAEADCCRAAVAAAQTAIELGQQFQSRRR